MTVASFSARCGLDFCDALWVSRMVRRGCDGPGFYGPAGLMVVARCLMRAASGQAAAKARRMRDTVSITRAPSLMSRRRMVVNAFASACALYVAGFARIIRRFRCLRGSQNHSAFFVLT